MFYFPYYNFVKLRFVVVELCSIFTKQSFNFLSLCFNFMKQSFRILSLCFNFLSLCFVNVELRFRKLELYSIKLKLRFTLCKTKFYGFRILCYSAISLKQIYLVSKYATKEYQ